jgi:hypothetical protein
MSHAFSFNDEARPHAEGRTHFRTEFLRDCRISPHCAAAILRALSMPRETEITIGALGLGKYQWTRVRDEAIELRYCEVTDGGYWLTDWPGVLTPYSRKVICKGLRKREIPSALRWEVWERDDFRCRECGARRFLSVDHIKPESKGGTLCLENLRTLCSVCNGRKGDRS